MKTVWLLFLLAGISYITIYPLFKHELKCKRNKDERGRFTKYNDWYIKLNQKWYPAEPLLIVWLISFVIIVTKIFN